MTAHLIDHLPAIVGQPDDKSVSVWRYMDLAALISLIDSSSLSFTRADCFEDPYEGTIPTRIWDRYKDNSRYLEIINDIRKRTYINCWHLNKYESDAMWRLYCPGGNGVAIRSTYETLAASLPATVSGNHVHLGEIIYRDYDEFDLPDSNFLKFFYSKRLAFQHENEVRIYIPPNNSRAEIVGAPRKPVEVELSRLILDVRVSPLAGAWYLEVVQSVLNKYGIALFARKSDMGTMPNSFEENVIP